MTSPNPGFMPSGWPYNQTGSALGAPANPWLQQAQWAAEWEQTPMGQRQREQEEQAREYYQKQAEQQYQLQLAQNERAAQQLALTEGAQKAQQWLARENLKLAKQAAEDQRLNSNRSWQLQQAQFGLSQDQFAETQLQNDRSFGMGLLDRQLQQRGPQNAMAYIDALDGAEALQPESGFLRRMVAGQYQPTRGAMTGRAGLIDDTASPDAMRTRRDNDMRLVGQINANPANYANTYRRLNPYQAKYVNGAIEYGGGDSESFIDKMRKGAFGNRAGF